VPALAAATNSGGPWRRRVGRASAHALRADPADIARRAKRIVGRLGTSLARVAAIMPFEAAGCTGRIVLQSARAGRDRPGLRVVFDLLHHRCHDPEGIDDADALAASLGTWPAGVVPKVHFSSPRLDVQERRVRVGRRVERRLVVPQLRAHADLVDPMGFEHFLRDTVRGRDFDVMLEA
jgi:hypothetical protein